MNFNDNGNFHVDEKLTQSKHGGGASLNNNNASSRKYLVVFGIFALVIVTTAASFAFFAYSRVGQTTTTITSGDIEFTYKEGEDASLANAFPVADSVGANDTSEEYTFTVNLKSSSAANKMNYNVYLLDANDDENTNYFTNEQIKFVLIKDNTFVAGTSATEGRKLSSIAGFTAGEHEGEGLVLEDQEITSGKTDEYKLRIWISDDVNYSNTDRVDDNTDEFNDAQTSVGKYNSYKYSLKVKVTSGTQTSIEFNNITVSGKTMTVELSDPNGLDAYAVTTSSTTPGNESSEWIEITNDTAKSNVKRTANGKITAKTITHTVESDGVYYLHVRNDINQISKKSIIVGKGSEQTISFDSNGGNAITTTKVISYNGMYGELPTPTREGYGFKGWFTATTGGTQITSSTKVTITTNQTLYAQWVEYATGKIMNLAATNTNELRIDEHEATGQQTFATTEYRYYGATPNNYVEFNNELWRIIGVFKVDDGTGNIEERVKIIRANPIGGFSWDSSDVNTNKGFGVNEWTQADVMTLLNSGAYYNRTTGTCYNGQSNATISCDFSENSTTPGLTSEAKEMIGNAKWYLGAHNTNSVTTSALYGYERGSASGKKCTQNATYCSDNVTRKPFWVGQVGLMYASDYGYSANMTSCSSTKLWAYDTSCKDSTWLFNSTTSQFTLSPSAFSDARYVFLVNYTGALYNGIASFADAVSPVTYLKSDIKIIDGVGTDTQPFILSK